MRFTRPPERRHPSIHFIPHLRHSKRRCTLIRMRYLPTHRHSQPQPAGYHSYNRVNSGGTLARPKLRLVVVHPYMLHAGSAPMVQLTPKVHTACHTMHITLPLPRLHESAKAGAGRHDNSAKRAHRMCSETCANELCIEACVALTDHTPPAAPHPCNTPKAGTLLWWPQPRPEEAEGLTRQRNMTSPRSYPPPRKRSSIHKPRFQLAGLNTCP
jgi:hypothetical protein